MAKLRLLADGWRQVQFDDNGRRTGFRRYRKGSEVEVPQDSVERLLNMKRFNKPYFEEVKATEEKKEESRPQGSSPSPTVKK